MLAQKYGLIGLSLLSSLVAAAPIPNDDTIGYLVPRTNTAAKKEGNMAKKTSHELDKKLSPSRDKAVFWSGQVKGASVIGTATEYAKKHDKETLEMGLNKAHVKLPAWGQSKTAPELWDHASKLWAERAKGETIAFLGQVRPQSVYNTIEKPLLEKNTKVTKITEHNLLKKPPPEHR
ncbi:hypothetical protein CPB83DRAFT_844886 [Crepidotus variabilis]|uniref:Uncharacterized protein n=1 Tax=Crepidotus variabilis TaxID=179855 RepID=A0A9P6EQ52_9AGAR|nr:hypothetical protein CPB83DRAFT_844886 [Crepidotus variabilis]